MAFNIPQKILQSLLAITLITTLCPSAPAAAQEGVFANNNAPISEQNSLQSEPDAQQLQSNAVDITNPGDFHVGYGSESSSDIPYASFSNYGLTETLYSADDLKDAGCSKDTITSIAFNVIEADMLETTSVKIYFGLTNDNSLSQFVDANNLTLVYEGSPTIGKIEGWEEIKLDKPFDYDGSSNLIIAVSKVSNTYSKTLKYESSKSTGISLVRQSGTSSRYADINSTIAGDDPGLSANIRLETHDMTPEVTIEPVGEQEYTGEAICPEPTIRYGDEVLTPELDYNIKYNNNTDAGTATITINGIGNYTGEREINFTIEPINIATATETSTRIAEVGQGLGSTMYAPFMSREYYSATEQLYTAEEIIESGGTAGDISSIAFHISQEGTLKGSSATYYIGATKETKLDRFVSIDNLQNVNGRITGKDSDNWQTITLNKPFAWDGESNIVVAVYVACPPFFVCRNSTLAYSSSYIPGKCIGASSYESQNASRFLSGSGVPSDARPDIRLSINSLAVTIENIQPQFATGTTVEPKTKVSFRDSTLVENKEYNTTYEDNIEPGTGYAVIKGQGNFSGTRKIPFSIISPSFAEDGRLDVQIGNAKTPVGYRTSPYGLTTKKDDGFHFGMSQALYKSSEINASSGGSGWLDSIAYYVTLNEESPSNSIRIYIETTDQNALWYPDGSDPYLSAKSRDFHSVENATLVYEGSPTLGRSQGWETLDFTTPFEYDGKSNLIITVVADLDNTSYYSSNKAIGMFLKGNQGLGSTSADTQANRPVAKFTMRANIDRAANSDITPLAYKGSPLTPEPTLSFAGKQLTSGVDYTLSYENNSTVGIGNIIVTGIGCYAGTKRIPFTIKDDISRAEVAPVPDATFCGSEIRPLPSLSMGGVPIEKGKDYELSYEQNINAGTGIIVATGTGDRFSGEKRIEFTINRAGISEKSANLIPSQEYTGKPVEPSLYIDGLAFQTDYDVVYKNNTEMGTATATAIGKGNYQGELSTNFQIVKATIRDDYTAIVNDRNPGGHKVKDGSTAVWGFTLNANSIVAITTSQTSTLSSGNALSIALKDDDGRIAFEWNEPALPNSHTRAYVILPKGKWHLFITALGKQYYTGGRPVIVGIVAKTLTGEVEKEQNGSITAATPIKPNSASTTGTLYDPAKDISKQYEDNDYWTFDITQPANTKIRLTSSSNTSGACIFQLLDERGEAVKKDGISLEKSSLGQQQKTVLDCGKLPAGKYCVKISVGNTSGWGELYALAVDTDTSTNINECSVIVDQASIYNGKEQKPLVLAKNHEGNLLLEGTDYTTEYRNNISAGNGTVIIKGKGQYSGQRIESFTILPATVDEPIANSGLTYTGAPQTGVHSNALYSVEGGSAENAGTHTATAALVDKQNCIWKSTGNSEDINVKWSIVQAPITRNMISDVPQNLTATGSQLTPNPTVQFNGQKLEEGRDYVVSYGSNISPGKDSGTVTVSAIDGSNFSGSATTHFSIVEKITHSITYMLDGGTNNSGNPSSFDEGSEAKLFDPTKEGYEFEGWYEDALLTRAITSIAPDTKTDITVYAKWNKNPASLARLAGNEAADTSAKIAQTAFPEGSEWVVIARDDDFADAMSATGLAGALEAPIVLTDRNGLSDAAADAVKALGAEKAYIIGGKGAIPGNLESELEAIGCQVIDRIFGNESWDTSAACAKMIAEHGGNPNGDAIVAMSSNFQDALSISSFAYKYKVPIFLETNGNERELPSAAREAIENQKGTIYVPGGPGAVPRSSVEDVFGKDRVARIFGEDGYDTSNQIATYMVNNKLLSANTVCIASGAPAPKGVDALAGAALAGKAGGVMLLANDNPAFGEIDSTAVDGSDSQGTPAFLTSHAPDVGQAYLLGGNAVIGADLQRKVTELLGRQA